MLQVYDSIINKLIPRILPDPRVELQSTPELLYWDHPESIDRIERSRAKAAFFSLANHFEAQANKFFCGPASAVMVLNALRGPRTSYKKPQDCSLYNGNKDWLPSPDFDPTFERYTQLTFFNSRTDEVKTLDQVYGKPDPNGISHYGLELDQLARMLAAHDLTVHMRRVGEKTSEVLIRRELIESLSQVGSFVIVNYSRAAFGGAQQGSGHIAPLGAYDSKSDSFLIMDVNPSWYPWTWVPARALISAMRTHDVSDHRGYLRISEPPNEYLQAREVSWDTHS